MEAERFIIVPAFNAEKALPAVLEDIQRAVAERGRPAPRVVVVDDGSTDRTAEVAESRGALVLRHPENRGKGAALRTGLEHAHRQGASSAVTMDADGQHRAEDALRLLDHEASDKAFVIGVRDLSAAGAPRPNRLSNTFSNTVISFLAGEPLLDTQSGLRRYPLPKTLELDSGASRFAFEADVLLRAARNSIPICHEHITVLYPKDRTTHFNSYQDPARIVFAVVRAFFQVRRKRRRLSSTLALLPPFFVTVTAPEVPSHSLRTLLDACSTALSPRVCLEASPTDTPSAIVSWDSAGMEASIRLNEANSALTRTLTFQASDPEIERYRAIGFAIGTWAQTSPPPTVETPESPAAPAAPTPILAPAPAQKSAPERPRSPPTQRRRLPQMATFDLHGLIGTGSAEAIRYGGGVGISVLRAVGPLDLWLLSSGAANTPVQRDDVLLELAFWSLAGGIGTSTQSETVIGSIAVGPFMEAAFTSGPDLSSGSRVNLGIEGFALLRARIAPHLFLLFGAETGVRFGSTVIVIDDQEFETIAPGFVSGRAGISLSL